MPYPPQNRTTFISITSCCLESWGGCVQGRQRENEHAAPLGDVGELLGDLGFEIPRQCKYHVRPILGDLFGLIDRNPCAGSESSMLVGVSVDRVLEQVAANSAIVE